MQAPRQIALDLGLTPPPPPAPVRFASIPIYSVRVVKDANFKADVQRIRVPRDAASIFRNYIGDADREHFVMIMLDTKNQVIGLHTVSIGDLSSTIVHPREVFKIAIALGAASIIVAHNHPSGDMSPSPEDVSVSKRLAEVGDLIGIELLDHLIIGDSHLHVSLKEKGLF